MLFGDIKRSDSSKLQQTFVRALFVECQRNLSLLWSRVQFLFAVHSLLFHGQEPTENDAFVVALWRTYTEQRERKMNLDGWLLFICYMTTIYYCGRVRCSRSACIAVTDLHCTGMPNNPTTFITTLLPLLFNQRCLHFVLVRTFPTMAAGW